MAELPSPLTTYSDTTPQKRVITDVISLIDPSDVPMIEDLGGLDGASSKLRFANGQSTKVEWLEDTLIGLTGALNGSITSTTTTITMSDGDNFQEGQIIQIDSERMWVSSVDNTTEIVTVTRAFEGSSATHADAAAVAIIGMARLEGADSDDIAFTDRTSNSNYTSILQQEVKVTRTQQGLSQWGIADELAYQADKVVPSLTRLLERHFFYNTTWHAGSATTPRSMAGYQAFVTNNKVSGATLAQTQFEAALLSAYTYGGKGPWSAYAAPVNLQKVKAFYDSSNFLRVDRTEKQVGMVIESILTPFGIVNLVLDRWAKTTEIPLIDPKHAGFLTYYPFTQEPLAKVGDYERAEVVGEFTLCIRQDKAHAMLTNVS